MQLSLNKILKLSVFSICTACAGTSNVNASWGEEFSDVGKGSLIYVYKQDPSFYDPTVLNNSTKKSLIKQIFIPRVIKRGPSDNDMAISVSGNRSDPNVNGDFTYLKEGTKEFDSAHTYAVTRQVYDMWRGTLGSIVIDYKDPKAVEKAKYWDSRKYGLLNIYSHAGTDTNAYYSRAGTNRELRFFDFASQAGKLISTCKSSDVVAHEAGHSILDIVRPDYWDIDTLQSGGFHESFGDQSTLFFLLTQDDLVESLVTYTKGDLHRNNFASFMAEEFGTALGLPSALRNADTNYNLDEVDAEVHAVSEVFTGVIYDSLVSGFNDAYKAKNGRRRSTQTLQDTADYLRTLILHAVVKNESKSPTFKDIALEMINLADFYSKNSASYMKDLNWKSYLTKEFTSRGIFKTLSPSMQVALSKKGFKINKKAKICGTLSHKKEEKKSKL